MNSANSTTLSPDDSANRSGDHPYKDRYLTIPNLICGVRIVGSLGLIGLAAGGYTTAFVVCFVLLSLSDWIDGKLARWLNQRSDFGARLDSASDSVLYVCLLIGCLIMKWDILLNEAVLLGIGLGSYALTTGYGLWKYGKVPSYHTRLAKLSQWLVLIGATCMLLDFSIWPLRIAIIGGTLTNLEATAMTYCLPEWTADVLSIFHVREARQRDQDGSAQEPRDAGPPPSQPNERGERRSG